jgi:hypothetical protein
MIRVFFDSDSCLKEESRELFAQVPIGKENRC